MSKVYPRLSRALLALALSLAASASARAQDTTATPEARADAAAAGSPAAPLNAGDEERAEARNPARQTGGQTGGAQQPQNPARPAPLTSGEKIERSFRAAFLRPAPYAASIFSAGLTQLGEDRLPHKDTGDEIADWGSRAARGFGRRAASTLFSSGFYAALFKQDPRYERSPRKGFARRTLHAVSRVFVTRDDDWNLEPNYSRFAGSLTASALSNLWEHSTPGRDRVGADATFRRFAGSFTSGALSNIIFREFGPDIIRIFRR